jgi:uncharacterized protein
MKKIFSLIILLVFIHGLFAQSVSNTSIQSIIKNVPNPQKLVNDYAGILTEDQKITLETKLVEFDNATTNQITVVIVNSVEGNDIADVALEIGRSWGVGGKKDNNGVILLIAANDRKLNISPGYGLEKALPDAICNQIIEDIIVPNFKGNDYYGGINKGTTAIIDATKGEYKATAGYSKRGKQGNLSIGRIIFLIAIIIVLLSIFGGGNSGGTFMSRRGFIPMIFPGGGSGGGWSGGGGSSGGSGFGGFGGGSFGGGGSSGSW